MLLPAELALPSVAAPAKEDPQDVEIPTWVIYTPEHPNLHGGHALEASAALDQRALILSANWECRTDMHFTFLSTACVLSAEEGEGQDSSRTIHRFKSPSPAHPQTNGFPEVRFTHIESLQKLFPS